MDVLRSAIGLKDEEETKPEAKGLAARPEKVTVDTAVDVSLRPKVKPVDAFVVKLAEEALEDSSLRPRARPDIPIDGALTHEKITSKYGTSVVNFLNNNKNVGPNSTKVKVNNLYSPSDALDDLISKNKIEDLDVATSAMALGVIPVKGKSYTPTIKDTQTMLSSAGYNVGKIDGIDGPLTQAAVKAFQKDAGFTGTDVDGKFGPKTLAAFIEKNPQITKEELPSKPLSEPFVKRQEADTSKVIKAATRFPYLNKIIDNKYIDLATSTPAKLLMKNIMGLDRNMLMGNTPIPITETSFKEDELQHFRNMWNKYGAGLIRKGQQIDSVNDAMNVITGKDKAPYGLPADIRAYYSVGDTNLYQDENGDVILKDIYDYNLYTDYTADPIINPDTGEEEYPRLKTEEFEAPELGFSTAKGIKDTLQAFTSGKIGFLSAAHNLGFLLGSRDYQDPEKDQGTPMLINLGNPETWDEEGKPKASDGLMSPTTKSEEAQPDVEPSQDTIEIENLVVSDGTREQFPATGEMFNISLDYNSFAGKSKYGTEVIIPDGADDATKKAANLFNKKMVEFAAKYGIKNYRNRGVFTTSENKKRGGGGKQNTIHAEPFFLQHTEMVEAVDNNFEEFSKIYIDAFGSLPARIVAPHTESNQGATSETFGSEFKFGKRIIDTLMRS